MLQLCWQPGATAYPHTVAISTLLIPQRPILTRLDQKPPYLTSTCLTSTGQDIIYVRLELGMLSVPEG